MPDTTIKPIQPLVNTPERVQREFQKLSQQLHDFTPAALTQVISDPPTKAEMDAIQTALNSLASMFRKMGGGT